MTEFERITQSPETLGAFLASLSCIEGPWDVEFQKRFAAGAPALIVTVRNLAHTRQSGATPAGG